MKKIGIITFHRSHNCGSMLESFAIQNVVKRLGFDNELINFSSVGQRETYMVFSKKIKLKKIVKNILFFPFVGMLTRHYHNYEEFIKNNLIVSNNDLDDNSDLEKELLKYSTIVAGSDQIWNITISDYNKIYFLPVNSSKIKKIAYAPSFGAKNILKYSDNPHYYSQLINNFDYLSSREENGKLWIKELTGRDVEIVLDPTLLLDKSDYSSLECDSGIKGEYIFYYCPEYYKNLDCFVKKISEKYKLPVIVWNSKEYILKGMYLKKFKMAKQQDPGIYLNLIKNASLVITTSFHGTIFSTIYSKKFWVLKNGGMYGDDDRVKTLVSQLSIEDRLIEPNFNDEFNYMIDVDYNKYKINLSNLRNKSLNYLKKALKNNKGKND